MEKHIDLLFGLGKYSFSSEKSQSQTETSLHTLERAGSVLYFPFSNWGVRRKTPDQHSSGFSSF